MFTFYRVSVRRFANLLSIPCTSHFCLLGPAARLYQTTTDKRSGQRSDNVVNRSRTNIVGGAIGYY